MPQRGQDGGQGWRKIVGCARVATMQVVTQAFDLLDGLGMDRYTREDEDSLGKTVDAKCISRDVPGYERVLCAVGCGCCLCTACLSWLPFCGSSCARTHNELSTIDQHDDTVPLDSHRRPSASQPRRRSSKY